MQIFTESVFEKVSITFLVMLIFGLAYFSFGVFLFVTRRKFGHININVAIMTKRDRDTSTNKLRYKSNETNVPLREVLHNRYLFWYVVWCSLSASFEKPVLQLHSHAYAVLSPLRGRAARPTAGMEFKRIAGSVFVETAYQLCIVYDHAEDPGDKRSRILRAILVPQEVFENFEIHRQKPPINTRNWELLQRIYEAFETKSGSFIRVDITTA